VAVPVGRPDNYSVWLSWSECCTGYEVCHLRLTCDEQVSSGQCPNDVTHTLDSCDVIDGPPLSHSAAAEPTPTTHARQGLLFLFHHVT